MKLVNTLLTITLLTAAFSCAEEEARTEMEYLIENIEDEGNVERLLDKMAEDGATAEIKSTKDKFKIIFPVINVKQTTSTLIIDDEEVEMFHHTANMQGKDHVNLAYQMDCIHLDNIEGEDDIKALFKEQREYILSATNGKLEYEKVIEKNNAPGRHLYLTIDGSKIKTNYEMYYKDGIFYSLSVVTKEGNLFNKASSRFFESFEILD